MNKITLADIMPILNEEILLANDFNIKNSRYKTLEFLPSEYMYKVVLTEGESEVVLTRSTAQAAINKYNEFDVDKEQ